MAKESANRYEEERKKRLEYNQKRFKDLGILKIAKSLSELKSSEKKSVQRHAKPKSESIYMLEPRRSTRERNPVPSYRDDLDYIELPRTHRKSSKLNSSWASYLARPIEEVKTATYEERNRALKSAEKLQSNIDNPSFVKSMLRSHVYSCFWLGLPTRFCEDHLSKSTVDVVLEDEYGTEFDAVYIGKRVGLSGGWRGFALHHKLDDGDAVVFEMITPTRFKVYIIRASDASSKNNDSAVEGEAEYDNAENTPDEEEEEPEDNSEKVQTRSKKRASASKDTSRKRKK